MTNSKTNNGPSVFSAGQGSTIWTAWKIRNGSRETPWGEPSDDILFAEMGDVRLRFLPRHGRGHAISPSDVNYRANIDALKRSGCTDILSISAVGSLATGLRPR